MEQNNGLTKKVKEFCRSIGVDIVGFADPNLYKRFPEHNRPEFYLKESKTVIIIGIYLYDIILDAWSQDMKSGKNYQFADAIIENLGHMIKQFLIEQGYNSKIIPYTPGLFLKDSAALAGIGSIGKNNLLLTEQYGSQLRLRALTTTAPLVCGTPILESKICKNCNKCIESCPANAFPEGIYNKHICYTYQLSHLSKLSEYTSIWCNICIESCPIRKNDNRNNK